MQSFLITSFLLPLFILLVAYGCHISITAPQPTVPANQRKVQDLPTITTLCVASYKFICWGHAVIEISIILETILRKQFPKFILIHGIATSIFGPHYPISPATGFNFDIGFPTVRVLGGLLVLLGSGIRYLCYKELGRHFTFQVAILENHNLITTGPYNIVRHPAYIGGYIMYIGMFLWHATPGAWLRESHFYTTKICWTILLPTLTVIANTVVVGMKRPKKEDEMLQKEFGRKWDEWAQKVPYRLIPGVY